MPIDVVGLVNEFGIPLILLRTGSSGINNLIAEVLSEDDNVITVKNLGTMLLKSHFDEILKNKSVFVIPDGYEDSRYEIVFSNKLDEQTQIKKSDIIDQTEVKDTILVSRYISSLRR